MNTVENLVKTASTSKRQSQALVANSLGTEFLALFDVHVLSPKNNLSYDVTNTHNCSACILNISNLSRCSRELAGLSLKRASAVLYRTTFPTGKKKKKKIVEKKKKSYRRMPASMKGSPLTEFDL